jgi:hypothetical protein
MPNRNVMMPFFFLFGLFWLGFPTAGVAAIKFTFLHKSYPARCPLWNICEWCGRFHEWYGSFHSMCYVQENLSREVIQVEDLNCFFG